MCSPSALGSRLTCFKLHSQLFVAFLFGHDPSSPPSEEHCPGRASSLGAEQAAATATARYKNRLQVLTSMETFGSPPPQARQTQSQSRHDLIYLSLLNPGKPSACRNRNYNFPSCCFVFSIQLSKIRQQADINFPFFADEHCCTKSQFLSDYVLC